MLRERKAYTFYRLNLLKSTFHSPHANLCVNPYTGYNHEQRMPGKNNNNYTFFESFLSSSTSTADYTINQFYPYYNKNAIAEIATAEQASAKQ